MSILDRGANAFAVLAALSKSQAIIEFDLSGKILTANENFCRALGYELSEIVGRHHSMFVEPSVVSSQDYKAFWSKLASLCLKAGPPLRPMQDTPATVNCTVSTSPFLPDG